MNSRINIWVSGVSIITKLQIQSFSISFTFFINLEVVICINSFKMSLGEERLVPTKWLSIFCKYSKA